MDRADRLAHLVARIKALVAQDDLYGELMEICAEYADAERALVLVGESGRASVATAKNLDKDTVKSDGFRRVRRITNDVHNTGVAFISEGLDRDERHRGSDSVDEHDQAVMALPIRSGSRTPGVVYLDRKAPFDPVELDVLQDVADIAGFAVEARRRLRDLRSKRDQLHRVNQDLERVASTLQEDIINQSVELTRFREEVESKQRALRSTYEFGNIVGRSALMHRMFDILEQVMDYPVPVLVTGESGTGKELIARALHYRSSRSDAPFMAINCAAIPENLLESELFGFKRGAFTGAKSDKDGLFRAARNGTVFLDEIGEMPMGIQAKLLRVIQEKEVRPIGGTQSEKVEARIVAATNRDLAAEVADGTFREDLYYRLNVVHVQVPPLRARREDIPVLTEHFLDRFAEELEVPRRRLSRQAMHHLVQMDWPGNVRQLENAIKSSTLLSRREVLDVGDLRIPEQISVERNRTSRSDSGRPAMSAADRSAPRRMGRMPAGDRFGGRGLDDRAGRSAEDDGDLNGHRIRNRGEWEAHEREQIVVALVECGWNKTKAARKLNISRRNLYRKIERYGIESRSE